MAPKYAPIRGTFTKYNTGYLTQTGPAGGWITENDR